MLCLGRKVGEVVWVGDDIRVMVVAIEGTQVKLGISAPPEVRVDRAEIRALRETATTDTEANTEPGEGNRKAPRKPTLPDDTRRDMDASGTTPG